MSGDQVSDEEKRRRTERLVDWIFAPNGTVEKTHESDCFACDLAAEIAGSVAAYVHFGTLVRRDREDDYDGWQEPATLDYPDALPGDTRLDMAFRIVAHELHQKLHKHGRRK